MVKGCKNFFMRGDGQSVGAVRSRQTAAEIVAELVEEAEQQLIRR